MRIAAEIVKTLWAEHTAAGHRAYSVKFNDGQFETIEMLGGPGGGVTMRSDGRIFLWKVAPDAKGRVLDALEWVEADEASATVGVVHCSKRHPSLRAALPTRGASSVDCQTCTGAGTINLPQQTRMSNPGLASWVYCDQCRALGWVDSANVTG